MTMYGDQDYYPDVDDDDLTTEDDGSTVHVAFATRGRGDIDVEQYKEKVDYGTNAVDLQYTGIVYNYKTVPLATYTDFVIALASYGWRVGDNVEETDYDFQADVERM